LRENIGMVTQDTSLLHRSVRENILYGRPAATESDMFSAAQRAEAESFILGLRDLKGRTGFDAHVGERGVKLSGGQRQRIAIARVMLKDAPILLLDEATSALDSEVESAIQRSLYRLMEGKTVVAIAHRLSTIAAMDRLIVLDQGRIIEQGDHETLLSQGGLYALLWAHQSGGFLGEMDTPENLAEAAVQV
jgi:ATP-binding cassette subfamily B multidrug efflux pump